MDFPPVVKKNPYYTIRDMYDFLVNDTLESYLILLIPPQLLYSLKHWKNTLEIFYLGFQVRLPFCFAKKDCAKRLYSLIWRLVGNHHLQKYLSYQLSMWPKIVLFL